MKELVVGLSKVPITIFFFFSGLFKQTSERVVGEEIKSNNIKKDLNGRKIK